MQINFKDKGGAILFGLLLSILNLLTIFFDFNKTKKTFELCLFPLFQVGHINNSKYLLWYFEFITFFGYFSIFSYGVVNGKRTWCFFKKLKIPNE